MFKSQRSCLIVIRLHSIAIFGQWFMIFILVGKLRYTIPLLLQFSLNIFYNQQQMDYIQVQNITCEPMSTITTMYICLKIQMLPNTCLISMVSMLFLQKWSLTKSIFHQISMVNFIKQMGYRLLIWQSYIYPSTHAKMKQWTIVCPSSFNQWSRIRSSVTILNTSVFLQTVCFIAVSSCQMFLGTSPNYQCLF